MQTKDFDPVALQRGYQVASEDDFLTFLGGLIIPSASGPKRFDSVAADFQRECFKSLAPSIHAVRDGKMPPCKYFWIERTKKASKDADLAACILWLLCFPKKPTFIQIGAADKDQAAIVRRRIDSILYYNTWINERIEVHRYKSIGYNKLSELEIVAADISGSHGETPDLLVLNELSHVLRWEFIQNLMDNAAGVPRSVVLAATNAGYKGTIQEVWRNNAIESERWSVHLWQQPAPWQEKDDIEEAKKRNSKSRFNRLWKGKWSSGKGDALDEDDIERCFHHGLRQEWKRLPGYEYIAGLDLGISHDHTGLVVIGVHRTKELIDLKYMRSWEPRAETGKVDLIAVERECLRLYKNYNLTWFGYDPHQAILLAQRLQQHNVPMREVIFNNKNITTMADTFLQLVRSGQLRCYDDNNHRLRRDFGKFNLVEKSYGHKLEAVSDEHGHADVGTALIIALPRAVELLRSGGKLMPDDDVAFDDTGPLTESEVAAMPKELREIYEMGPPLEDEEGYAINKHRYKKKKRNLHKKSTINDSTIPNWDYGETD